MIPPAIGMGLANYFSRKSRTFTSGKQEVFLREENEWLLIYSKEVLQNTFFDYFIFGHRHLPLDILIDERSRYINLGEWISYSSYAVFDGVNLELKYDLT